MALNKPGIAGEISGKLQGAEFARNRGRTVIKKAKTRKPSFSPSRMNSQNYHRAALAHWRSLTDAQRSAWKTAAALRPRPDRFGIPRTLTALQLFLTIPHDFRQGLPVDWADVPPIREVALDINPVLSVTAPNTIFVDNFHFSPSLPSGYASFFISRWQSPNNVQRRNWKCAGLYYGSFPFGIVFTTSAALFNVRLVQGETILAKIRFYKSGTWPVWYDFGQVTVS